jgi:chromate transporter
VSDAGASTERSSLAELARVFLRLGATAFGGPAAHIAMMKEELVERRRWLDQAAFLDLVSASNLIPGPTSTELALHLGWLRRGWRGLLVAGVCFILPSALLTAALAHVYLRYGELPAMTSLLRGVKPAMLAVILRALWELLPTAMKTRSLTAIGICAVLAAGLGADELLVLLGAGLVGLFTLPRPPTPRLAMLAPAAPVLALPTGVGLLSLFLVFVKIGAVLFGSGYVLVAFLRADLVERLRWLTEAQLVDAIAVGQVTPGPVFTTATFIGYLLRGPAGALVATVAIFLPAFILVAVSGPLVPRLRRSASASAFLDAVNVASLGLMALVLMQLARVVVVDRVTVVIAVAAVLATLRWRVGATWILVGGALVGLVWR